MALTFSETVKLLSVMASRSRVDFIFTRKLDIGYFCYPYGLLMVTELRSNFARCLACYEIFLQCVVNLGVMEIDKFVND